MIDRRQALTQFSVTLGAATQVGASTGDIVNDTSKARNAPSGPRIRLEDFEDGAGTGNADIDTRAFLQAWRWATNTLRMRVGSDVDDHVTMVDKGPIIELGSGPYLINRSLSLDRGSSALIKIRGLGQFSTRIQLVGDIYLIDSPVNFVGLDLSEFHCVGGKGLLRLSSVEANVGRGYFIEKIHVSNFSESAILSKSQDQPYFKIRDCHFLAKRGANSVAIELRGFRAGSEIISNVFWRSTYMIKLAPQEAKGPTSPINICFNDFTRIDKDTTSNWQCVCHIWIVPNPELSTNDGKGIMLLGNKHGNENISNGFSPMMVADENTNGGVSGVQHSTNTSTGYVCGVTMIKDCVNFSERIQYPLIKSFTRNLFAFDLSPLWGSGIPSLVCEYVFPESPIDNKLARCTSRVDTFPSISAMLNGKKIAISNSPERWTSV